MRKILFSLLLLLSISPCFAQGNPQCPTRPVGDSTNACASTAFVQGAFAVFALPQNQIFVGNASNVAIAVAMSQDCTIVSSGVITCTSTNNVPFAPSATTDTTNATNISSGTLAAARMAAFGSGDVSFATAGGAGTIAANAVSNAKLATMPANTAKVNATSGVAVPTNFAMPSCSAAQSALIWTTNTGFGCNTLATGGTVSSITQGVGLSFSVTPITTTGTISLGSGNRVLLNTLTGSGGATLADTTSFTSTYKNYEIELSNILPSTNASACRLRVNVGGVQATGYLGTANSSAANNETNTTQYQCSRGTADVSNAGSGISGLVRLFNAADTTAPKMLNGMTSYPNSSAGASVLTATAWYNGGNAAVTGIQLDFSAGNVASGVIRIFGIVN